MMQHLVWIWLHWWTHSVFRIIACWNKPEGTMSDLGSQTPHFTGEKPRSALEPNTGLDPCVPILVYFPNATATSTKTLPFQPIAQQRSQGGKGVQVLQDFMWLWSQPPQQERPWLVPHEGVAWGLGEYSGSTAQLLSHNPGKAPYCPRASGVGVQLCILSAESGHFSHPIRPRPAQSRLLSPALLQSFFTGLSASTLPTQPPHGSPTPASEIPSKPKTLLKSCSGCLSDFE